MTHETYKKIFNRDKLVEIVNGCSIVSHHNLVYTTRYTKRGLVLNDKKRFWLNDGVTSRAYGHPDNNVQNDAPVQVQRSFRKRSHPDIEDDLDINYKKLRYCRNKF